MSIRVLMVGAGLSYLPRVRDSLIIPVPSLPNNGNRSFLDHDINSPVVVLDDKQQH